MGCGAEPHVRELRNIVARYALLCDVEKCTGCYACFLACKDEHVGNDHGSYAAPASEGQKWIDVKEIEYGTGDKVKVDYIPVMCQHCSAPACAKDAPEGAVYTRQDGIVLIDPQKAKGAKIIVDNCPYGAVYWNDELELPQKCTLCAHMLDSGAGTTRCVECCPTGALVIGDIDNPESDVSKLSARLGGCLESYKPMFGTHPQVKYCALPKPFIAGELAFSDRIDEPASGIHIKLISMNFGKTRETVTDAFGDFIFKRLQSGGEYTLRINTPGYLKVENRIRLNAAQNLGTIMLSKVIED